MFVDIRVVWKYSTFCPGPFVNLVVGCDGGLAWKMAWALRYASKICKDASEYHSRKYINKRRVSILASSHVSGISRCSDAKD